MIEVINSKTNKKIKDLLSLYDSKTRKEKGMFVIEGFHLLEMALKENYVISIFTLKEIPNIDQSIKQYIINEDIMKKISKMTTPQGVVAVCRQLVSNPIIGNAIYIEDVSDPGNLGTILRSALAFGYRNIILSKNSVSIYNEKVISSSQGAIFSLNIINESDGLLTFLKSQGYSLYVTVLHNSINIKQLKCQSPFIIAFGNEARGVSSNLIKSATAAIKIEMDNIDSLNVAIAASICMFILNN